MSHDAPVPASTSDAPRDAPPSAAEREAADGLVAEARESTFRAEALDARWSAATAAKVQQALVAGADAGGSTVRSVECRSRTCRVEIGASEAPQFDTFMHEFAGRIAGTLGSIAASHAGGAEGARTVVLYLSR